MLARVRRTHERRQRIREHVVPDRIRTLLASLGIDEAIPRLEAAVAVAERTGDATALAELRRRLGVVRESTAAVARP